MDITEQNLQEWQPPAAAPAPGGRTLAPAIDEQGRINIYTKPKEDITEKALPEWTPAVSEATGKPFTWRDTWPVRLASELRRGIISGATAPGDIMTKGLGQVQPEHPGEWTEWDEVNRQAADAELYHRSMDTAGLGVRPTPSARGLATTLTPEITPTSGEAAAATAQKLGAPLPVGLASDNKAIQGVTAALQSVPFAGARISNAVAKTEAAAGDRIENISKEMTQGITDRASSNPIVVSGLEKVAENNKQAQDAGFNYLRSFLPQEGNLPVHPMPRTKAAMDTVALRRTAAGEDPEFGFGPLRNIQDQVSFNGMLRARANAVSPNIGTKTNPGYKPGDFAALKNPIDADLREAVKNDAIANGKSPEAALQAFEDANKRFGVLADQNKLLDSIVGAKGEGAINLMTGAAGEKGGNLKLLKDLQKQMTPEEFSHIGGTLLRNLGLRKGPEGNQFSLRTFMNNWGSYVSPGAKQALFSPQHLEDINEILGMGKHLGGALKMTNVSHTANAIIIYDTIWHALEGGLALSSGLIEPSTAAMSVGGVVASQVFTRMLARPAMASSARTWSRAFRGLQEGTSTPMKISAFMAATRNLSHNLGVPEQLILKATQDNTAPEGVMPKQPVGNQ